MLHVMLSLATKEIIHLKIFPVSGKKVFRGACYENDNGLGNQLSDGLRVHQISIVITRHASPYSRRKGSGGWEGGTQVALPCDPMKRGYKPSRDNDRSIVLALNYLSVRSDNSLRHFFLIRKLNFQYKWWSARCKLITN